MFELTNTPRTYAWGSLEALAEFRGVEPSGGHEAELWFGDHPANPAHRAEDGVSLVDWVAADSSRRPLRFLLKVLAVGSSLSVQAHPTIEKAIAGFDRETEAGIPVDSPDRNFKDRNHKPEIILALTPFSALSGFRSPVERRDVLMHCLAVGMPGAVELSMACEQGLAHAVALIARHEPFAVELAEALSKPQPAWGDRVVDDALATAKLLATQFPGDPGAVFALLLNHVVLKPGEALFVPAGTVHAYISGLGVEVMASSDNVLRGGLTSKHIDVDQLIDIADFSEGPAFRIEAETVGAVTTYPAPLEECVLASYAVDGTLDVEIAGPAIAIVTDGAVTVSGNSSLELTRSRVVFIESGESVSSLSGRGNLVVARQN